MSEYASEMGNLIVEYVETIHPYDERKQDALMARIMQGNHNLSVSDMRNAIRGEPQMAMAAETYHADVNTENEGIFGTIMSRIRGNNGVLNDTKMTD